MDVVYGAILGMLPWVLGATDIQHVCNDRADQKVYTGPGLFEAVQFLIFVVALARLFERGWHGMRARPDVCHPQRRALQTT